ncbi:unnamed protein product [Musa textilis]
MDPWLGRHGSDVWPTLFQSLARRPEKDGRRLLPRCLPPARCSSIGHNEDVRGLPTHDPFPWESSVSGDSFFSSLLFWIFIADAASPKFFKSSSADNATWFPFNARLGMQNYAAEAFP